MPKTVTSNKKSKTATSKSKPKRSKIRPVPDNALDPALWKRARKDADTRYQRHSAYKSAYIVKRYKELGGRLRGRKNVKTGLARWLAEDWRNQRGEIGYQNKTDIYRPMRRITKKTPITHSELTSKEIARARRIKASKGRVNRFRPQKHK